MESSRRNPQAGSIWHEFVAEATAVGPKGALSSPGVDRPTSRVPHAFGAWMALHKSTHPELGWCFVSHSLETGWNWSSHPRSPNVGWCTPRELRAPFGPTAVASATTSFHHERGSMSKSPQQNWGASTHPMRGTSTRSSLTTRKERLGPHSSVASRSHRSNRRQPPRQPMLA